MAVVGDRNTQTSVGGWHVPPWVQVPSLQLLLGKKPGDLRWEDVERLVKQKTSEGQNLEFKSELYDSKDGPKELAKDVVGFANAGGGLLVIGLAEDEHGGAARIESVELSDAERNRMREILSRRVAPLVPDLQLGELHDPSDQGRGIFLILVPASDAAPHGVTNSDWCKWPVREDRTTRYMHESELAARYRERFSGAERQQERLEQVGTEGIESLWLAEGWLALSVVPSKSGRLPADRETYREWLRNHLTGLPWGLAVDAGTLLGRRRVIFTDRYPYNGYSADHHLELHTDGAGFAAIALAAGQQAPTDAARLGLDPECRYFGADHIAGWTVALLDILAHHSVRTGGGGDLSVRAQLVPGYVGLGGPGRSAAHTHGRSVAITEPLLGGSQSRMVPGSRPLIAPTYFDTIAPISIVTSPRDLVSAAADIAQELVVEFGSPPTTALISIDGSVSSEAARASSSSLIGWARQHDLLDEAQLLD